MLSLDRFNELLKNEHRNFRFEVNELALYSVKKSKKSGKADVDLPSKIFYKNRAK
jgi:hypothetical protein